ncbi:MAG TPA: hypothetical protein H9898_08530 [Candidatus Anaerobiospirillum stercoravium]|nr:hypothetical protein [Candidatus Anaerobiospirillum stercoravium]
MLNHSLRLGLISGLLVTTLAVTTLSGCTNPTSTAGKVSYFTEGVITDLEYITIDLEHYNTQKSAVVGGVAGAAAGQVIGGDTEGTLIGAGIGALLAGAAAAMMDRTDEGIRLTINTNQGLILVDQPYSCTYQKGSKVRLINQSDNTVQVQVLVNGSYRTAQKNKRDECPL